MLDPFSLYFHFTPYLHVIYCSPNERTSLPILLPKHRGALGTNSGDEIHSETNHLKCASQTACGRVQAKAGHEIRGEQGRQLGARLVERSHSTWADTRVQQGKGKVGFLAICYGVPDCDDENLHLVSVFWCLFVVTSE